MVSGSGREVGKREGEEVMEKGSKGEGRVAVRKEKGRGGVKLA